MARPPRKTVDYFPHFIGDGKKIFFIEQKYGNDGYAVWFRLLETLAKTEDHWLNLNEETEVMFMAARCRVTEETLISILDDLAKLGEIDSELWHSKVIWCDRFIESIEEVYVKRSNNCMTFDSLREHLQGLGILKGDVKPQTKLNYTKLNKSNDRLEQDFDTWWNLYDKKIGKAKTLQKWQRLTDEERNKCLEVVKDYVKATPDEKYRKHPLTYLNGSHWEDQINVKKELSEYEKLIKGWR